MKLLAPLKYFFLFLIVVLFCNSCRKTISLNISTIELDTLSVRNFQDIVFISKDTGFIVGGTRFSDGQIISTFDGGNTWHLKDSVSNWVLSSITATPTGQLFAVGVTGKIFNSTNRGKTWNLFQTLGWYDLQRIICFGDSVQMAVGGDGGSVSHGVIQTLKPNFGGWWHTVSISRYANNIQMLNLKVGYIAAYGAVFKTIDGGVSWNITEAKGDNFTALHFFDEQHGLVIGYEGTILETTDGGNSWNTKRNGNSPFTASWEFTDMAFSSETVGYIVGVNGLLLKTTDAGNHWKKAEYFSAQTIRKIYIQTPQAIWLPGDGGTLYKVSE